MACTIQIILGLTILLAVLPHAYAFGAGDIPDFAYLNEKAFRHGDIENILESLVKYAGHASASGSLLGFASHVIKKASGGSKFSKGDIKKVYFGNWLRDYSQCMDIAGLSKLSADTLILVVSVLGFMTFGFATEEFEVTADRLDVYLCVEHIDNPKGYAEKEGDAREFHPKLRPPVDPRELEIDERTGMKKYMATEDSGWDTSTALIRRVFRECIERGRRSGGQEGADLFEAYRLLGTGLHTMEDLLAHSNWCEIGLRKLGYEDVFCHVGDDVLVEAPSGDRVPPLVTGTFGSADFLHSLLGEATDHISQASVTALSDKMSNNQNNDTSEKLKSLKDILGKIGGGENTSQAEELEAKSKAYDFNPDDVAPPEVQRQLLDLLKWHDDVMRNIIKKMEMVPGLNDLMEEMSNALNAYIYTVIAPWLTPILTQATSVLGEGSKAVIDSDDQYQVFDDPSASDPSHSLLSKDHFGLILNEPAGKIAQVVVVNTVQAIVKAWAKDSDPDRVIDEVLEAFHHPYYATGRSEIQRQMFDELEKWVGGMGQEASGTIANLTKDAVREHRNKREDDGSVEPGYGGCGHGGGSASYAQHQSGHQQQSYGGGQQQASYGGGRQQQSESYEGRNSSSYGSGGDTYGGQQTESYGSSYGGGESYGSHGARSEDPPIRHQESSYGRSDETSSYGRHDYSRTGNDDDEGSGQRVESTYGSGYEGGGGRREESGYGGRDHERRAGGDYDGGGGYGRSEATTYGRGSESREETGYSGREYEHRAETEYGGRGQEHHEDGAYGRREGSGGYNPSYINEDETFGAERLNISDNEGYGGRNDNSGRGYGRRTDEYEEGNY